jgi:Tfp pilus assembly protein PilF
MRILLLLAFVALSLAPGSLCAQDPDTNAAPAPSDKLPTPEELLDRAGKDAADGHLDSAISESTLAIQLNPKLVAAYELRGSVYLTKKLWDKAERDFTAAYKINPDAAYKYKLAEIHYLQRDYDDARPRFAALQSDKRLGDLATYKVFLCDLLGSHEVQAQRDLAAMDAKEQPPSFLYSQAAWDLYHNQRKEANAIIGMAAKKFSDSTGELYLSALIAAQRFNPGTASFTARDGTKYTNVHVFLESDGLRVMGAKGWITLPVDQLPDDLSGFTDPDLRDQIKNRRQASAKVEEPQETTVSFTTQSGKSFHDARWAIESNGVAVLGPDGWVVIPFSDLPADIRFFPPEAREKLAGKLIRAQQSTVTTAERVTFTSKRGRTFDNVRATLTDEGIRVLSNDGWMMVAARDVPDDLSPFPEAWKPRLTELKRLPDVSDDTAIVTFTTRSGKQYNEVRCSLESRGVRVISPDGLICVTWKDLPDDISIFPAKWRPRITDGKQTPVPSSTR